MKNRIGNNRPLARLAALGACLSLLVLLASPSPATEAHRCYYDATTSTLHYAERVDGVWRGELVDERACDGADGESPALAIDGLGEPNIAYYDAITGGLKYASRVGGAWTFALVDYCTGVKRIRLSIGVTGIPRIDYVVGDSDARRAIGGAGWSVARVDGTGVI